MRILVISDSHGRNDDIEGVLKTGRRHRYDDPLRRCGTWRFIHTRNSGLSSSYGRRKQ